jgi:ACS family tartrate transporter-like MFS transporter
MVSKHETLAVRTRTQVTRRLIPYLMFVYLLAYLDRANIGVAKLGMQKELGFSDAVIGFGSGIFFLGYLLLDLPGSLIVERWSARKWIAGIMICWGIIAFLAGFIGTPLFGALPVLTQFYAMRLLLGIAEAGFFPGVIVYLSHWFRMEDRARAKAWFMVTQPLAVALGIPASRWILENVHWAGIAGWRWVFILEGLAPFLMGFVTLRYLTDRPASALWLGEREKRWLIAGLESEQMRKTAEDHVNLMVALRLPQTYLLIVLFFLIVMGNQALIFFIPSITDTLKDMSVTVRTMAASLPYAFSAVGILINGMWANRTREFRWHTALPVIATSISLGLTVLVGGHGWHMVALLCLAGFTSQAYLAPFFTLPTLLLGKTAAAAAVGLVCLGNLGGFAGPWLFGYLRTATGNYDAGLWLLSGCMLAGGLLATQIRIPVPGGSQERIEVHEEQEA